jgi:hypothetical protein
MAFRLSGILAGAAKRGSERLKTLEEDTKKLITTEASRVGAEMEAARKQRTKDTLDYNRAARKLKSQYQLSDAQIEAVLAGGLQGVEQLDKTIGNAELNAKLQGKVFDDAARSSVLATVLPEISPDIAGRSLEEQAAAFAAANAPYISSFDTGVSRIGDTVAAMTRSGKSPDEYIRSQLAAQTRAFGGEAPEKFTGAAFGAGTGFGFRPDLMTVEGILAAQKTQAEIAGQEASTAAQEMSTQRMATLLPLEVDERKAAIEKIGVDMGFTQAQTERIISLLPSEVAINEGKVLQIGKDLEKTDAIIAQMAQENEQIAANTELLRGRLGKLAVETDILSNLGEAEMQAKIDQMNASSELSRKRSEALAAEIPFIGEKAQAEIDRITAAIGTEELTQDKLAADIALLDEFGAKEKQAALDLIESKILVNGSYSDLEEFQVAIMAENKRLEDSLPGIESEEERAAIEAQIARNNERIGASAIALADTGASLNKGQAPTVFGQIAKQSLQGYGLKQEYSSLDQIIANIDQTQMPNYFKAIIEANDVFGAVYGGDRQGQKYADAKIAAINAQLADYAARDPDRFKGSFTSINELADSEVPFAEGDVVSYQDGEDTIYAIFSGGEMVRAIRSIDDQ